MLRAQDACKGSGPCRPSPRSRLSSLGVSGGEAAPATEICHRLLAQGEPVRALVRRTSDTAKLADLRGHGAEIVMGDLREPASLEVACAAADSVITTVTPVQCYEPGVNDIGTARVRPASLM